MPAWGSQDPGPQRCLPTCLYDSEMLHPLQGLALCWKFLSTIWSGVQSEGHGICRNKGRKGAKSRKIAKKEKKERKKTDPEPQVIFHEPTKTFMRHQSGVNIEENGKQIFYYVWCPMHNVNTSTPFNKNAGRYTWFKKNNNNRSPMMPTLN